MDDKPHAAHEALTIGRRIAPNAPKERLRGSAPSQKVTSITFNLTKAQVGQVVQRQVRVQVADADGLVAETMITVEIFIVERDDTKPPICRVKPWLPQCQDL